MNNINVKQNETIIDITRSGKSLLSVKALMPIWTRTGSDNRIYITLPLLGGLETFSENKDGVYTATEEAFKCFCIASEELGDGLEQELVKIGWQLSKPDTDWQHSTMNLVSDKLAIRSMMNTGTISAIDVNLLNGQVNTNFACLT